MATTAQPKTVMGGRRGGNILEFYAEEFKPLPSPAALFRQHVIQWFFAAKTLRIFEAQVLSNKPSPEDLASHEMVCSALITFGAFASLFVKQRADEIDLNSLGISVGSIEAETRLLRHNFRMFHDDTISDEEAEAVLQEAFKNAP